MTTKAPRDEGDRRTTADKHASTLATQPGRINPYRLGMELFKDIEARWNRGAHGREYRECDDAHEKRTWDTGAGEGLKKIFEVRRIHNDQTFLDAFLTPEFIEEHKLFTYGRDPRTGKTVILDREHASVKRKLLQQFTNMGQPIIELVDANYENRGELYLVHRWEAVDLREDFARATLQSLHRLWTRPVHIQTAIEGKLIRWTYDGKEESTEDLGTLVEAGAESA